MSAGGFRLLVDKKRWFHFKRDLIKFFHHSGANVDNGNSNNKFCFGENHNFI